MVNLVILRRAIVVGVVFELLLVVAARFYPWLKPNLLFGCMFLSGVAGLLYARDLARGFLAGAFGGAVIGALCGVVAVYGASFLNEEPDLYLHLGVIFLTLIGAVGGLFGQLDAIMKAFLKNLQQ